MDNGLIKSSQKIIPFEMCYSKNIYKKKLIQPQTTNFKKDSRQQHTIKYC